jgi:hypothetical protein
VSQPVGVDRLHAGCLQDVVPSVVPCFISHR